MALTFNTTGNCIPGKHYMLPPRDRLTRILRLVDEEKYFVFYGGWQTGKTTCAKWLEGHYNQHGPYACLWVDIQTAREQPDPQIAFETILTNLDVVVRKTLPEVAPPVLEEHLKIPLTALMSYLQALCQRLQRPLVLLFDEVDSLVGPAMVSFLTQLRQGYLARDQTPFPRSVVLIGRRQIRDYTLSARERRAVSWLGTASPFNITAEALSLAPFTAAEVRALLQQHTAATGQIFREEATARIFELSQGHPWLVNALAAQIVHEDLRDRAVPVERAHVDAAKETLIQQRRSHIDSLVARLREGRVQRIIEPMLTGGAARDSDTLNDDFSYVLGLGLIAERGGQYVVANPIYQEVIPRVLTFNQQMQLHLQPAAYRRADGGLDLPKLMRAWQKFWRKDGHLAAEGFSYREAGPHLMLMAFLQRVVNGGGRIEREYALGRGALDLLICFAGEQHVVEVKLRRDSDTGLEALEQILRYLDGAGLPEGWLVLFDLRKDVPWQDKLTLEETCVEGKRIWVVGC